MADRFTLGETKVRPGVHFRQESGNELNLTGAENGIVALAFKANWGPLGEVVTIDNPADIATLFGDDSGTGSNVAVIEKIFQGGASQVKAVRVGSGGTKAAITLKDTDSTPADVVTLTAKYAGTRALSVTIKDSLSNASERECIIYAGTKELFRTSFAKGSAGEVDALVAAINGNSESVVTASKVAAGNGLLAAVTQATFTTAGVSPTITSTDYSDAFALLEAVNWNTICIDSNDTAIQTLLKTFINRANDAGLMGIAVIGEPSSVAYATRKTDAAACNSENVVYVLNGFKVGDEAYEGFNAAAVIAGLIAYTPANQSLTHVGISGATEIIDPLTNAKIVECLQSGALIFTEASNGAIWVEQGINTLTVLGSKDAGWKKIRRTKTRFELITRINQNVEPIIGAVDNDSNGRATVIAIANGVISQMVAEHKLIRGSCTEDASNPARGDSAWFIVDVIDLDSIEHVYLTYRFHFAET